MAITEDVKSKWYQALFEEDCLVVMELLNAHPSLLMIGRKSEPSRQVEGRRRREGMGRTQSTWKGRTALHVGASRGCLQLIIQVLGLCFDDFCKINELNPERLSWVEQISSKINELYQERLSLVEKFSFSKIQVHPYAACDLCDVHPISGNRWKSTVKMDYDLCQNCYEQNGKEKEFVKIETGLPHGPVGMDTISFTKRTARDTIKETPGKSAGSSDDVCNSLQDPMVEMAAGRPERAKNKAAVNNKKTEKASHNRGQNARDLLRAKDGEYGLNALAIAALNGNQELMALLCFGIMAVCSVDPGQRVNPRKRVDKEDLYIWASKVLDYFPLANLKKRKLLRQVMVERALAGHVGPTELKEYYEHRDFNFLPPEEYLFHFSLADPQERRTKGWDVISSFDGELWRFLLQLHDAQGRPPFHVAIEESQEEYFFELLGTWSTTGMEREMIICALTTTDRLGRTPVHRAAAKGLPEALGVILKYAEKDEQVVATCNASWRAHEVDTVGSWEWAMGFSDIWGLPEDDDFPLQFPLLQTPLHAAIIHGNFDCAKLLIGKRRENWGSMPYLSLWGLEYWPKEEAKAMDIMHIFNNERRMPTRLQVAPCESPRKTWIWIEWDVVELACLVGAPAAFVGFLIDFLKVDLGKPRQPSIRLVDPFDEVETDEGFDEGETHEEFDEGEKVEEFDEREKDHKEWRELFQSVKVAKYRKWKGPSEGDIVLTNLWHPLHLAAAVGKCDVVKYIVNDRKWKPFFEDFEGNSVLHHAMKVRDLELTTHFLDYVDSEHIHLSQQNIRRIAKKQILDDNPVADRQGCINVLLHTGCEVFKTNKRKQLPYPTGKLNDSKFLSWWYSKQQEEFKTTQNDLNFATNAIAVSATLVATASYVGPLQPPMGYDANQIQYENVWVSIFIVCDTLSFYFAIFAITLSLIPSLSLPQQAMLDELQRTRGMVILAVGTLLPSIFFVFVAFAASSISVMSANITSETGGILTIVSTIIGVVLCLLGFTLFSIRLLAFVYPKNPYIRNIYELSNYITKFSEQ